MCLIHRFTHTHTQYVTVISVKHVSRRTEVADMAEIMKPFTGYTHTRAPAWDLMVTLSSDGDFELSDHHLALKHRERNKTRQIKLKREQREREGERSIHLVWVWSFTAGTLSINERKINSLDRNQHPQIFLRRSSPPFLLLNSDTITCTISIPLPFMKNLNIHLSTSLSRACFPKSPTLFPLSIFAHLHHLNS